MTRKRTKFFLPLMMPMFFGVLLAAAAALSSLGLMAASAWLIAAAAYQPPLYQLSLAILGVRVCGILRAVFRYAERYVSHDAAFRCLGFLRLFVYRVMADAPAQRTLEGTDGDLADLFIREIDKLKDLYLRVLLPVTTATVVILAVGAVVFFYAPLVSLLLAGAFFLIGAVIPYGVKSVSGKRESMAAQRGRELRNGCLDLLYGCADLLACGRARDMLVKLEKQAEFAAAEKTRLFRRQALSGALAEATGGFMVLLSFIVLFPLLRGGEVTGIQLTVIVLIMQSAAEVLLPLPSVWQYYAGCLRAARKLFFLPQEEKERVLTEACGRSAQAPLLAARNLSFSYDGRAAALKEIDFSVFRGERVAIVGASGAGKSTLGLLILALRRQERGCLALNGVPYCRLSPEDVRENFNVVLQETHFFQQTIRENFQMLRPECKEEEMWTALKNAGADVFVKALPDGIDTHIGQHGRKLSGGQRQRLALAAAFLKPAPILLLDEPTRGLDAYTAKQVRQTIFSLPKGQTILLVTHELADLEAVDRIVVLESGRVVETGPYRDLMERKGVFYSLRRYC